MSEHTAEKDARCSCGSHAIVFGDVPDPGCVMHGERGIQAWSTCPGCGARFRHVVGHTCPIPPDLTEGADR